MPSGFSAACHDATSYLRAALPLHAWLVVVVANGRASVLAVSATPTGWLAPGPAPAWLTALCLLLLREGQHVAMGDGRESALSPAADPHPVRSWVAATLPTSAATAGGLPESAAFLVGLHPDPLPDRDAVDLALIGLIAQLLGLLLGAAQERDVQARRARAAEADAERDPLTGTLNRRGWLRLLELEEERARRYDRPTAVVVVDLDGLKAVNDTRGHAAGDAHLQRAAAVVADVVRVNDVVARLGGDEFGVLAVETEPAEATRLTLRIAEALGRAGVPASVGVASRAPGQDLHEAWERADRVMYEGKRERRTGAS